MEKILVLAFLCCASRVAVSQAPVLPDSVRNISASDFGQTPPDTSRGGPPADHQEPTDVEGGPSDSEEESVEADIPSTTEQPTIEMGVPFDNENAAGGRKGSRRPSEQVPLQPSLLLNLLKKYKDHAMPASLLRLARLKSSEEEVVVAGGRRFLHQRAVMQGPAGTLFWEAISPLPPRTKPRRHRTERSNPDTELHQAHDGGV